MSGADHFCKEPCVSVIILNSHPMRCAIEVLKGVYSKTLTIDFYKDRFIIYHSAEDERSHCKIEIKKNKLFFYSFNPFKVDGVKPTRVSVTVGVDLFMQSIKNEKKQDSCFNVVCSYNTVSSLILFSQERSGSVIEQQPAIYSFGFEEDISEDDPFRNVYCDYEENSTLTEKDIESNIGRFKVGCQIVNVQLKDTGVIKLSAAARGGRLITITLPCLYETEGQDDATLTEAEADGQDDYKISLRGKDLDNVSRLKKLGTSNTVRVYMSTDYPLLFQTLVSNYGKLLLWFTNPT